QVAEEHHLVDRDDEEADEDGLVPPLAVGDLLVPVRHAVERVEGTDAAGAEDGERQAKGRREASVLHPEAPRNARRLIGHPRRVPLAQVDGVDDRPCTNWSASAIERSISLINVPMSCSISPIVPFREATVWAFRLCFKNNTLSRNLASTGSMDASAFFIA